MQQNEWVEGTTQLLRKWERTCSRRKSAHYRASNSYGWRNKLLSIPIILISTILGSLSFIGPSFLDKTTTATGSRLLYSRNLQSLEPTSSPSFSPTNECIWEKYNTDHLITASPYCDNSIVKYQNDYYQSTLSDVDELVCDRDVNFVGNTAYNQFPVASGITTPSEAEAWCVERDDGHGIFYQRWVDGQIICMVLEEAPNNIILHAEHLFGGVCLSSGLLNNPTQTYINNCGNQLVGDVYNGNCALIENCVSACPGIVGGYDLQEMGFQDCPCCYDFWEGCSWGECSTVVNSGSDGDGDGDGDGDDDDYDYDDDGDGGGSVPTTHECIQACMHGGGASSPASMPTYSPTYTPTKTPTYTPTKTPTYTPTKTPTYTPTKTPTYTPTNAPTHTSSTTGTSSSSFTYIIGAFNMLIAILSALHTFLKYDTLEDRHHQYSRHFGALQVDIETLLAKPQSQRGNAITTVENYKTKYAVLINNAPDLPEKLEIICCSDRAPPATIELS